MRMRSLLFVPGDSDRKFEKALTSGADVLICDLEDAVATAQKATARIRVAEWLARTGPSKPPLFVRVNPLSSGFTEADLTAVVQPGLSGIVIPKADGAQDLRTIAAILDHLESKSGLMANTVRILVVATETPAAMFALASYAPPHPRLVGLTWGAEDLGAAIGIITNKGTDGGWTFPFQVARAQCLFAAANAQVAPIETLYSDFRDEAGLERDCREARRDGFTGRIAIHPAQVATINRCFTPSVDELADARRIVKAFAAAPDAGALSIDGRMIDMPHLITARKILAAAGEIEE